MLIVALTGGIGSGKSIIADALREQGCYVHSADKAAHELLEPGRPAWEKAVAHFGENILNPDRTVNRAKLGKIIFENPKERVFLNSLMHPLVMEKKREVIARLEKDGKVEIFVSEAALTIEAGFAKFFDKIVVAYCPEEVQITRLMERDGIPKGEALKKIRSQMPAEEKKKYADYVIDTSGSLERTLAQTQAVLARLHEDAVRKKQGKTQRRARIL
jgi:dephospho-CoA kinase